jgi:predicted metal-dependent phosphoesterase TrpH
LRNRPGYGPRMDAPAFDLQSHSLVSDGSLAPADVVARAAEAGVELLSLTDHDSISGISEARAAGSEHGVRLVTGVELSAVRGPDRDVHVLGYGFDPQHPGLAEALARFRADRELRVERMVERLEGFGLAVDGTVIEGRRGRGLPVGRPHLAEAVLAVESNRELLVAAGADSFQGMFDVFLAEGARAWVPRTEPDVADAIAAVHAAGGVAVWAHPFLDVGGGEEVLAEIDRFRADGLDGVECFYPTFEREQVDLLCDHCEAHGLLRTGSSDFHAPDHARFDRFRAFWLFGREPELGPISAAAS